MSESEKDDQLQVPRRPGLTGPAIVDPKLLFSSQLTVLKRVLFRIYEIADDEARKELREGNRYRRNQQHPHQVFLIDGARGSGKTTLLLTILHNLKYLGRSHKWKDGTPSNVLFDDKRRSMKPAHGVPNGTRQTAFYLPILFPSDLEMNQSIMEGLLALMISSIEDMKKQKKDTPDDQRWKREADGFIKRANEKVARGWFLSKNAGIDAILRDSADYEDYLTKRGKANVTSFARVQTWREFVNEFLDFFQSELLVVFFDDTDVALATTQDILHTMRIFLDHPRIVTVIAANLRAMRQGVLLDGMRELGVPMDALGNDGRATARDWRRFVRRQIEEYLEKVLPRPYRQYIQSDQSVSKVKRTSKKPENPTEAGQKAADTGETSNQEVLSSGDRDFNLIFRTDQQEIHNFDQLCGKMQNKYRDQFLAMKQKVHFRSLYDCEEIADDHERAQLENYISWWTLRHWYADALRPRSARHMKALKDFIGDIDPPSPDKPTRVAHGKRLAVILFESPDNYELIQRFSDEDKLVLQWLWRQKIFSTWYDQRYIEINDRRIHERTYSYQYLFYRIDLGIALPVHENPDETPPRGFLPEPDGPNLVGFRRFFPGVLRPRLFGVARDLHHTLIPANCIYLADLDALPDIAWKSSTDAREHWGRDINYKWAEYFFFDVNELRQRSSSAADTATSENSAIDVRDEWIKGYFLDVVLPLASIFVGQFVKESKGRQRSWNVEETAESTLLKAELARNGKFFGEALERVDSIRRRFHYAETLGTTLKDGRSAAKLAWTALSELDRQVLQPLFGPPPDNANADAAADLEPKDKELREQELRDKELKDLSGHLVDYRWIVNDVRCAWHAARIFLSQTSETLKKRSSRKEQHDHISPDTSEITRRDNFFRGDRYTIPTREAFDRWLTRSETLDDFMQAVEGDHGRKAGKDITCKDIGIYRNEMRFYSPGKHPKEVTEKDVGNTLEEIWLSETVWENIKKIVRYGKPEGRGPLPASSAKDRSLSADELKIFLTARNDVTRPPDDWPLILDPGIHDEMKPNIGEDPNALKQRAHNCRTNERLSRSLLLFFYGISPTLPTLIHVEVAAILRHDPSALGTADLVLDDWARRIRRHLLFIRRYQCALEVTKIRLDLMLLCQQRYDAKPPLPIKALEEFLPPTASTFGVRATLAPDMSYSSLGISGIRLFGNFIDGANDNNLKELGDDLANLCRRWNDVDKKTGRVQRPSLIDITIEYLVEALNFVETTREVIDPGQKRRTARRPEENPASDTPPAEKPAAGAADTGWAHGAQWPSMVPRPR